MSDTAGAVPLGEPPLSLYVHFPWCVRKCPYCDFNSHEQVGDAPVDAYVDALLRDLEIESGRAGTRVIESVFFGGGTPSLMPSAALGRVLETIARRFAMAPDCEITLEANPGASDAGRFKDYAAAGVNRLSIGVQSFDDAALLRLGRIHDGAQAYEAFDRARAAGIDNLNLDLMYGLPAQTPAQAVADVKAAIALGPEHISYYELTLEPNTLFYLDPPRLPDEDLMADEEACGRELLRAAGYERYEVSAYALSQAQCRHNLNYWRFGDYLGVGAGAHGKLTDTGRGVVVRVAKHRHPRAYIEAAQSPVGADPADLVSNMRSVDAGELPLEFMLNAGRLADGFDRAAYESTTGHAWSALQRALQPAVSRGLVSFESDRCTPSALGLEFAQETQLLLMDQPAVS